MKKVTVNDTYQKGYVYSLTEKPGINFDTEFKPELTPQKMLELGVFGGKYFNDRPNEFPKSWFTNAKLSKDDKDPSLNFYGVSASMPLSHWQKKGWIYKDDPRGWFQWYARYFMGRRIAGEDYRQIKRWLAMTRHIAQIKKNWPPGSLDCRKKQRQALLHWAYDSRKM